MRGARVRYIPVEWELIHRRILRMSVVREFVDAKMVVAMGGVYLNVAFVQYRAR